MSTQNVKEHLDEVIDSRIDEARKLLFKTDFWSSVLLLSVFLAVVLFISIVADQWLFVGGLSVTLRLCVFAAMFSVSAFSVYRRILPLFLYPINPVYAAQILDNNSASAKNSIINWITLKRERVERGQTVTDKLGEKIFEGLTRTAAESVNAVPDEHITNQNKIKICLISLAIIVTILVVYSCISPKNPIQSFARIVLPFASIDPPQAAKFLDIEPQNTTALQGERLTVTAKVVSKSKSPVYVFFSTDDGRAVKQAVPMNKLTGSGGSDNFWGRNEGVKFETPFPPGKQGFVSNTDYWIQQDESKSNIYRIEVRPVATVEVESLTYKYPDYTGLADKVVGNTGDIRAVSGTEVTVLAKSTMPLAQADIVYAEATLKFLKLNTQAQQREAVVQGRSLPPISASVYDKNNLPNNASTNTPKITMQIDKNNPTAAIAKISLKNDSPIDPNSNNLNEVVNLFSINATDQDGFKSRRSGTFRQEATRDQPPLIQWSDTSKELKEVAQIDLPLNAVIELQLQAEDPDFAIRYLRIKYKVTSDKKVNRQIKPNELLQSPAAGSTNHKGQIKKSVSFKPSQHKLAVGDKVEVWGEAVDTKLPTANTAETRHITIKIIEQQENKNDEKNKGNNDNKSESKEPNKTQENDQQKGNDNSAQPNGKNEPDNQENKRDEKVVAKEDKNQNANDSNENSPQNDVDEKRGNEQLEQNRGGDQKTENANSAPNTKNNVAPNEEKNKNENENDTTTENKSKNNKQSKPIDPETESADAMQKIVDQMSKDKWQPKSDSDNDKNNSDKQDKQDKNSLPQKPNKNNSEENKQQEKQDETKGQESKISSDKNEKKNNGENKQNQNGSDGEKDNTTKNDSNGNEKNQSNPGNQTDKSENQQSSNNPTAENAEKNSQNDKSTSKSDNQTENPNDEKNNTSNSDPNTKSNSGAPTTNNDNKNNNQTPNNNGNQTQSNDRNNPAKNSSERNNNVNSDNIASEQNNGKNDPKNNSNNSDDGKNSTEKNIENNPNKTNNDVAKKDDQEDKITKTNKQPVDPNDDAKRTRSKFDPKTGKLRNDGNDRSNPKESDIDRNDANRLPKNEGNNSKANTVDKTQTESQSKPKSDSQTENSGDKNGGKTNENGKNSKGENSPSESENNSDGKPNGKNNNQGTGNNKSNSNGNSENNQTNNSANSTNNSSDKPTDNPKVDKSNNASANGGTNRGGLGGSNGSIDAEAARREFTEKNVNLALDYLQDQLDKGKPSEELLDELGWTEDQLRKFHKKWREMSNNAKRDNLTTNSNEAWENALKSFNIRPSGKNAKLNRNQTTIKDNTQKTQSKNLTPPKALQKRFETYTTEIGK
ncbi:MAG: hypothetical protein LBJ00_13675 [Planctomycetaceae bacterium]|jgi:hypothetical protein|nr:hypothetical protein [Planctomycetaceae bacterium]